MRNEKASAAFNKLLDLADHLMGPKGCPWDREQTLVSIRSALLEEACEVIEAIDENDTPNLIEELGDIFYIAIFLCKLAEKEKLFLTEEPLKEMHNKLVARHPHVFGEKKVSDAASALKQWEEIKKIEKKERESVLDGIPKGLPSLARAYKIAGKMDHSDYKPQAEKMDLFNTEEELGHFLWHLAREARLKHLNPENALRKVVAQQESEFRSWEKEKEQ